MNDKTVPGVAYINQGETQNCTLLSSKLQTQHECAHNTKTDKYVIKNIEINFENRTFAHLSVSENYVVKKHKITVYLVSVMTH